MIINDGSKLLDFLVQLYFSKGKNLSEDKLLEMQNSLSNMAGSSKEDINITEEKKRIIDSFFEIVSSKDISDAIKNGNLTKEDFMRKFYEKIIGNKRKYMMRDLYSSELVEQDTVRPYMKKTIFIPARENIEHSFRDSAGDTVKITFLGTLHFKEWNGTRSSINKYKIQRKFDGKNFTDEEVYTDIIIPKMSEEDYRDAVFDELLSYNNISLSKCDGYIGKIEQAPLNSKNNFENRQSQDSYGYTYRINDKFMLHYDATEASATINFHQKNISLNNTSMHNAKGDILSK